MSTYAKDAINASNEPAPQIDVSNYIAGMQAAGSAPAPAALGPVKRWIKLHSKAIAGAIVGGAAAAGQALADGHVDPIEILTIIVAIGAGAGIVYAAPRNVDAP